MQLGMAGNPPCIPALQVPGCCYLLKGFCLLAGGGPGVCTCLWGGFNEPLHGTLVATSFWAVSVILVWLVGKHLGVDGWSRSNAVFPGTVPNPWFACCPRGNRPQWHPPTDPGPKKPPHVSIAPVDEQSYKQQRFLAEENLQMSLKLELNINQQINTGRCQGCLHCKLFNSPRLFSHAEERPEALQLAMGSKASVLCMLRAW